MEMSYRAAANLFEQGQIDFEGLRTILAELPLPVKKRKAESVADIYHVADIPDDDNSVCWLEDLYFLDLIDNDQCEELIDAAVDGKDSIPPS